VIHDICRVAFQRGGARILLAEALVQGAGAADSVRAALQELERIAEVDVIIVARGGGSADDLSCFHDEALVRAVAASRVPVVSAVGHEVDVTLVDFAADARAATPSQAAEMVVPDRRAQKELLGEKKTRLVRAMRARLAEDRGALATALARMGDPRLALASAQQLLDDRRAALENWPLRVLSAHKDTCTRMAARLAKEHPRTVLEREQASIARAADRIAHAERAILAKHEARLRTLVGRLDALSPLSVLARGYAIATRADGRAIRAAEDVEPGDRITVRAHHAKVLADVVRVDDSDA
jgi:exodeoxyribonuclease VII large subunit